MKNELTLVKSTEFGKVQCDFYGDGKEPWMTRNQVGTALEYSNPGTAIKNIHNRYKARLDKYSRVAQIEPPSGGGIQNVTLYNRKGVMEICRHSDQPKADAFMDFCWDTMDRLMSGKTKIVGMTDYQQMMADTRLRNARIQSARILTKLAENYKGTTYEQVLNAHATHELTGEYLLPLPKLEAKTFSAKEIGEAAGITAHMVGILTNRHGLKTEQYGEWFKDKAKGCEKEVSSFRYYESVVPVLRELIAAKANA